MKKRFTGFLAAVLLLALLSVGAAAEPKYEPLTLANSDATVTIDKARVIQRPEDKTFNIFYGVPADANITVTVTGAQEGHDLYIGAYFSKGEVQKDGSVLGKGAAECVLNPDDVLQRIALRDRSSYALEQDQSWVEAPGYLRQNGTYSFSIAAAAYVGWHMSLNCGPAVDPGHWTELPKTLMMSAVNHRPKDSENQNFLNMIGLIVETAVDAAYPAKPDALSIVAFTDVAENAYCYDAVQWAVARNITTGKTAAIFAPGETCTKGQILTLLWRASGSPEGTAANPFTDVSESDYCYKAALWAAERGLISGETFGASAPCTRAMTVTYLWTLAEKPAPRTEIAFTDVAADADYAQAVAWAVERSVTAGKTATTFAPDDTCTRGQIATFLYRDLARG